jgi:hypothetical protein
MVSEGGLGHREVRAVPPATSPVGEGRGSRGFVDMVGSQRAARTTLIFDDGQGSGCLVTYGEATSGQP